MQPILLGNFVISEISVNQVKIILPCIIRGKAQEQFFECYTCKRFPCILIDFTLGQTHPFDRILMSQHVISIRDHCVYAYHRLNESILLAYGKRIRSDLGC